MKELSFKLPSTFFDAEERCGYKISPLMKKVWAVELDLLNEFIRVCKKNQLRYCAIGGTLLGAIRHQGFIPWDDDIDIAMPREDYDRLQKIAQVEFKKPYFYQDEYSEPGILYGHAKLRNNETTAISPGYLDEEHGTVAFSAGIFIDIFPLDNIPDDSNDREIWLHDIKEAGAKAWRIRKYTHRRLPEFDESIEEEVKALENTGDKDYWFKKYDNALSRYSSDVTELNCMYCLAQKFGSRWEFYGRDFEDFDTAQFESLEIAVPKNYASVLSKCYNDWETLKQEGSLHSCINGTFFDVEHPYTLYVDKENGINRDLVRNILAANKFY